MEEIEFKVSDLTELLKNAGVPTPIENVATVLFDVRGVTVFSLNRDGGGGFSTRGTAPLFEAHTYPLRHDQ
jgi:hypothetical protein